jgi:hypothetical protein
VVVYQLFLMGKGDAKGQLTQLGGVFTASDNEGSRSTPVFTCICSCV